MPNKFSANKSCNGLLNKINILGLSNWIKICRVVSVSFVTGIRFHRTPDSLLRAPIADVLITEDGRFSCGWIRRRWNNMGPQMLMWGTRDLRNKWLFPGTAHEKWCHCGCVFTIYVWPFCKSESHAGANINMSISYDSLLARHKWSYRLDLKSVKLLPKSIDNAH
jgi:hypothetical protein